MATVISRSFFIGLLGVAACIGSPLTAHGQLRWSLSFSNDSALLASSEGNNTEDRGRVRVHRVDNGELVAELSDRRIRSIAFSPKVRTLLAGGGNHGVVYLWDVGTKKEVREFKGLAGETTSVAMSGDGLHLAGTSRGRLCLWDVTTGKVVQSIDDGEIGMTGVSFSADGKHLAFCRNLSNQASRVEIYDVATWKPAAMLRLAAEKQENSPNGKATTFGSATAFVPGEKRVLVSGGICVVSSKAEAFPYEFACRPTGLIWTAAFDDSEAKLLTDPRPGYLNSISTSPDGKHFFIGAQGKTYGDNHLIEWRNLDAGKLEWQARGGQFDALAVIVSHDGKLAASSRFNTQLWNTETGELVRSIP